MKIEIFKPSQQLARYVKHYWLLESDRVLDQEKSTHRIIPNGLVELLLSYGDDFVCAGNNNFEEIQPRASICGQKKTFFDVRQLGNTKLLSVVFTPLGASIILPFCFSELVNQSIHIDDIFPNQTDRLLSQVAECENSIWKVHIMEQYLIGKIKTQFRKEYGLMEQVLSVITRSEGQTTIDYLCDEFDINSKYIERKFTEYIGVLPKTFLRIVRFQNAIHKSEHYKDNLTELSYACGYYDQSHFNREIKTFSGYTPSQLFNMKDLYSDYFF